MSLLAKARKAVLPLPASSSVNVSHWPTEVRLAINGLAPALSAETYSLLASARRAILPLPASTTLKDSHCPTAVRLAFKGLAPALSAETYMLLASAFIEIMLPGTT